MRFAPRSPLRKVSRYPVPSLPSPDNNDYISSEVEESKGVYALASPTSTLKLQNKNNDHAGVSPGSIATAAAAEWQRRDAHRERLDNGRMSIRLQPPQTQSELHSQSQSQSKSHVSQPHVSQPHVSQSHVLQSQLQSQQPHLGSDVLGSGTVHFGDETASPIDESRHKSKTGRVRTPYRNRNRNRNQNRTEAKNHLIFSLMVVMVGSNSSDSSLFWTQL